MPYQTTASRAASGAPAVAAAAPIPSEAALRFLRTPGRFAIVATIDPEGEPHQAVVWYRLDGTTIVINSAVGRRWPRNLARDPRISFAVADGYDWVSLIGTVETIEDQAVAQADIAAMAEAYEDRDEAATSIARFRGQRRVSFRIVPRRIHEELEEAD
jgi:PPOX class probable F420-dependent enzyme